MSQFLPMRNGHAVRSGEIPLLGVSEFSEAIVDSVASGAHLSALFGQPVGEQIRVLAVLSDDNAGRLLAGATLIGQEYPSLTPDCPQAHWFERELAEQWRVKPLGHPWLKPIRFTREGEPAIGQADFFRVEGEEVHEVAVGPVHAGIIEPGHFRFQCFGEQVLHLEISLGYQHRGVELAMVGGPGARVIHYMETLAGDTTIGHATAYCQAIEALARCKAPARAEALRGITLELERLANHAGDLGALANDVGFLPTSSYCGRIRGDILNITAALCGSRFGRGMVRPGGVAFNVDEALVVDLLARLADASRDLDTAVNLLWDTPSVQARFESTGELTAEVARQIGLVGPAARACGLERDVRHHQPSGIYQFAHIPVSTWQSGDVFARAYVRWLEIGRSLTFVNEQLQSLPQDESRVPVGQLAGGQTVVTMAEGWRGEICHVSVTDDAGRLATYKVVDPSFHNWFGLAMALRGQAISDFPLCNKSFNLSYCGHDL